MAARINAAEMRRKYEKEKEREERHDFYIRTKREANGILVEFIREKSELFDKVPCDIKIGDTVILNKYSLSKEGNNGWDGGPNMLIGYLKDIKAPVVMKITDVYVDLSLASEGIDRFIDSHPIDSIRKMIDWGVLAKNFEDLIKSRDNPICDKYGLYRTAHFEYDNEFKPKWGLNVNSFLLKGTEEFDITYAHWKLEIELKEKQKDIDDQIKSLNERKENIKKELDKSFHLNK
jgi:hypothetical protein